MAVARSNYLPGDPRLIDNIVYELKSQGIFDNFRKECISDVDTKPAYQNLRQRVEGSVTGFLKTQQWTSDMNKNQVREMLRKTISESGFLETGVERIVDQVVNPKINSIFFPQVENIVYKFLGIDKPAENSNIKRTCVNTSNMIAIDTSALLPNDLEAVSPEYEGLDDKVSNPKTSNNSHKAEDISIDEDESPPFEPIDEAVFPPQEDITMESHLSGISDLTSHDSNHSSQSFRTTEMNIANEEAQNSMDVEPQNSNDMVDNQLSIQMSESTEDKLEIIEDSNYSKSASDVKEPGLQISFDNILEQVTTKDSVAATHDSINNANTNDAVQNITVDNQPKNIYTDDDKPKKSDSKHRSSDKYNSDIQHKKSSSEKHSSRECKSEKEKKSDNYKSDKHRSRHSSKNSNDHEKDLKDNNSSRKKDSRSDKDKHHSKSRHSSSHHSRDKSSKNSVSESDDHKSDNKSKKSSRSKSPKKDGIFGENDSKDNDKDSSKKDGLEELSKGDKGEMKSKQNSSKKYSTDSKHSKDKSLHSSHSKSKTEATSHRSSRDRKDSKSNSKNNAKSDNTYKHSTHKYDDKHNSKSQKYSSSSKKDKPDKGKKEIKNDDHCNSKEKKFIRRSTDRDSSDGQSGRHSSSSSFTESYSSSQLQKANDDSSKINSGSNSADSGNSDQTEFKSSDQNTVQNTPVNYQQIKLIKPKFASNIFEARRLLKIRKKIGKLERQNQLKLENSVVNSANDSIEKNDVSHQMDNNKEHVIKEDLDKDVAKRRNAKLNSCNVEDKNEHQNTVRKLLPKDEFIEERPKSPIPLSSSVISKESWDKIEAKLNSSNMNANYNSYGDVSEDIDSAKAAVNVDVSNCNTIETIAKEENQTENVTETVDSQESQNQESTGSSHNDHKVEVPKEVKDGELNKNCLYLVPEVLPERQRYFEKIAHKISLLEEEIARRTNLLILHMENQKNKKSTVDVSVRLPKIDIVDVNTDTEIVILPSKSASSQIKNNQDVHNNNKRKLQPDGDGEKCEKITNKTATITTPEKTNNELKIKKVKLGHNSVGDVDFNLPISPAESDKSVSSNSEKQKQNSKASRRTSSRQQSYTSDDLYKPRLRFASSRRRVANSASAEKPEN